MSIKLNIYIFGRVIHTVTPFNVVIYPDFLPTPRRSSHIKSDNTHAQSSRYTVAHIIQYPQYIDFLKRFLHLSLMV